MGVLSGLEPKKVFEMFEYLSSVPHGSGNTGPISRLCCEFAEKRGLKYVKDSINNVVIYKPATAGYENEPTVVIQGHLDMVCAKYPDDPMDMSLTPITLKTDGEFVFADRTSLGADDCIAVAVALAILDDDTLEHPALECVFTVEEETGMDGVTGIDPALISGRTMLNLDSEEDGVFTVGCAGGCHVECVYPVMREDAGDCICRRLTVDGLLGGHSGCEIHKNRANAIIIAARILRSIPKFSGLRLVSIGAGQFDNVIPSKAVAVFTLDRDAGEKAMSAIDEMTRILQNEYAGSDPGLTVTVTEAVPDYNPIPTMRTRRFLRMITALPNGVQNMSSDFDGLVETSLSTGIIRTYENRIVFPKSIRSSVASRKKFVADNVVAIVRSFGGRAKITGGYPGWEYNRNSALREKLKTVYRDLYGEDPVIYATHGGLEVGLFMDKLPGLDCVSLGPDVFDIHSVNEKVSVASVGKLYRLVTEFLKKK